MKRPIAMFTGTGHAAPVRVMTNDDFVAIGIETSDEWIRERTGIRARHVAGPGETLTSLAAQASRQALETAGVAASEVDAIVMGTVSPDHLLPAAAVEVQAAIGASRAAACGPDDLRFRPEMSHTRIDCADRHKRTRAPQRPL